MTRLVTVLALAVSATACGATGAATDELVVFAAASLTDAVTELGAAFTDTEPGTTVTVSTAASSDLAAQILEGAPADVFASADLITMARLTEAGAVAGEPVVFAHNRAMIAVAPGNPLAITGVADLADDDLVVVVCSPEVPCGRYATEIVANAGISLTPDSYEANVRAVLTKVVLGEADAGIVYATDVAQAGDDATGVEIPAEVNVEAEYPIAVTVEAGNPDGGQAFIDFVLGPAGQAILERHGFTAP